MWCAYVRARHEQENRRVFLFVLASLLSGSTGAYGDSLSTSRLVTWLDSVLTWGLKVGSAVKKILPTIKRVRSQ